jgi:hypothetical protein
MDRNRKPPEYIARSLRRFGLNPWGEPIYRIVWSESRWKTVGGLFHDGFRQVAEYRQVPMYRSIARWILEVWKETPCSPALWYIDELDSISGLLRSGPYPYRGEYWGNIVIQKPNGDYLELSPGLAQYFAMLIDKSRNATPWESYLANRDAMEAKKKATSKLIRAMVGDCISAFGPASHAGRYGKSKEKTRNYLGPEMRMPKFGQFHPHLIDPKKIH